jgi:NAD-dependent deacetylase
MSEPVFEAQLEKARDILARSQRVAAFSGAGLSAESGLSTFRDPEPDALWSRFDPTELASVTGFEENPQRVIDWYNWRRASYAAVHPNAAHRALAGQPRMIQVTQNVDHLLEQAGVPAQQVYHLHGSILHDRCHNSACDHREAVDLDSAQALRPCPRCGDAMRPAVVWFGENLPQQAWASAQNLCMALDCLLVIGTSATVYPAAGLVTLARQYGSRIIVIDTNPGAAGGIGDVFLAGPAGETLPRLLAGFDLASPDH